MFSALGSQATCRFKNFLLRSGSIFFVKSFSGTGIRSFVTPDGTTPGRLLQIARHARLAIYAFWQDLM